MTSTILLVFAFVFFCVGIFWNPPRFSLVPAGLAAWVLSLLIHH